VHNRKKALRCLWLTRLDPGPPDGRRLDLQLPSLVEPQPGWRGAHGVGQTPYRRTYPKSR
jgi:hypothetical protein